MRKSLTLQWLLAAAVIAARLIAGDAAYGHGLSGHSEHDAAGRAASHGGPCRTKGGMVSLPSRAPEIRMTRQHGLGVDGARQAAEQVLAEMRGMHGIRLDAEWHGATLRARGRGFEATIEVRDADVDVHLRLGLLLRPLRGAIAREVDAYLERFFGSSHPG